MKKDDLLKLLAEHQQDLENLVSEYKLTLEKIKKQAVKDVEKDYEEQDQAEADKLLEDL